MSCPEHEVDPPEHALHGTAGAAVMSKELLIAEINPLLDAVKALLFPTTLTLKSLKVARPVASVNCVVVPRSVPDPLVRANVIGMLASATLLLLLS
jgi:hypothetical protein